MMEFDKFEGKTFTSIKVVENDTKIIFTDILGKKYKMYHIQDCCEEVNVEDICGDINDLLNIPIIHASERSQVDENAMESGTWTFYHLATRSGSVVIRWYGESNGYYSESVSIKKLK